MYKLIKIIINIFSFLKGPSEFCFAKMIDWCVQNREIPADENQAFVCAYQINIDDDEPENFPREIETVDNPILSPRFFISTVNLLRLASKHCAILHADATYKLNWLGYPVLTIGISDMNNIFHPLGLAFTRDEKSEDFEFIFKSLTIGLQRCQLPPLKHVDLVADAADSIFNGFRRAFSNQDSYKRGNSHLIGYFIK